MSIGGSITGISFIPFGPYPASGGIITVLCISEQNQRYKRKMEEEKWKKRKRKGKRWLLWEGTDKEENISSEGVPSYLPTNFHPLCYCVHSFWRFWCSLCREQTIWIVYKLTLSLFSWYSSNLELVRLLKCTNIWASAFCSIST